MVAHYTFEDLSGSSTPVTSDNPYQDLIVACHNDPAQIQARYKSHRNNRNGQQRDKLLAHDFPGVTVDEILAKTQDPSIDPGFKDWRHCLVFWARPTEKIKTLISEVQRKLLNVAPSLWIMPQSSLHMTALEITHSLTSPEIDSLVARMLPSAREIADYTLSHRARLVKPMVSFDAQALALSFLPAAGEPGRSVDEDVYTYHHLRRDLLAKAQATGVKVASRYVIPSAHLTIGRFISKGDFEAADGNVDHANVERLVRTIQIINDWLEREYWPRDSDTRSEGEWIVGEEKGLTFRKGALWYGGGESVAEGEGF